MRRLLIAASLATIAAVARGESAAPVNSAYDQLPTMSVTPTEPTGVERLPALEPPARALAYPASTEPWTGPATASTLAPPRVQPSYAAPGQEFAACDACINCGSGCMAFGAYPPHSFWFANAELTILHPSYENFAFALDGDRDAVAPRLIFGWESPRGLGLRTRFWWLDYESEVVSDIPFPPETEVQFDALRFDFDVYRRFTFDGSSITFGGGITTANMGWELDGVKLKDAGAGASFFVEGRHDLVNTPVSTFGLVARGRWASLVGEWRAPDSSVRTRGDSTMEILEAAFGWDYVRKFRRCDLFVQQLIESQHWQSTLNGDIGFFGQSVSIGLRW